MALITQCSLAAAINDAHRLAQQHAENAVEHARRAGELLLNAKETVPHGQWLGWLTDHCEVSERQAQRYMRIAAKATPVSYSIRAALAELSKPKETRPFIESGSVALGYLGDSLHFVVDESRIHPGYWHVLNWKDGSYNARPVRADGLDMAIGALMESCDWQFSAAGAEPVIPVTP